MANYERFTALLPKEVFELAEQVLTERIPLQKTEATHHSLTLSGGDGSVRISTHRHGLETKVNADTDQLRTSRIDNEVQYFLTLLPYQPKDVMPSPAGRR